MEDEKKDALTKSALRKEQGDRLVEAINKKAPNPKCEICGHTDFDLNPHLASPVFVSLHPEGKIHLEQVVTHPCALVQCKNCGNSKLMSLHFLGIEHKDLDV